MSKPKHLIFSMAKLLLTNTLEGEEAHLQLSCRLIRLPRHSLDHIR